MNVIQFCFNGGVLEGKGVDILYIIEGFFLLLSFPLFILIISTTYELYILWAII